MINLTAAAAAVVVFAAGENRALERAPPATWTGVEAEIVARVDAYRASANLPPIPVSPSLTAVAQAHVRDLVMNRPDLQHDMAGEACSLHSWSPRGPWSPVCWTGSSEDAPRMWGKPRELTHGAYVGNGYEIAFGPAPGSEDDRPVTSADALNGWRGSPLHNAVVLERGMWSGRHWRAMGVGALGGFAVVWFSDTADRPVASRAPARAKAHGDDR